MKNSTLLNKPASRKKKEMSSTEEEGCRDNKTSNTKIKKSKKRMNTELQLFEILNKKTHDRFKRFRIFYETDTKKFVNKIDRDYKKSKKFPVHILKQIKLIDKNKYDSGVCILRGALPYSLLFQADGWKIHYVICGRKNEQFVHDKLKLRFNKNVDKTLKKIRNKRVLLIENNSFSGNTPYRTVLELKKDYKIKKPDLFLDYFIKKNIFQRNKKRVNSFGRIFIASRLKVSKNERKQLVEEFVNKLALHSVR
jgi:hypothetical protein